MSTPPALIDLDDPAARDPAVSGGKAAQLARARAAGLPALPGVVIPCDAARAALRQGLEALERAGSGGARLAVMDSPLDRGLLRALPAAGRRLGPALAVRSSSTLEDDPAWSGAFTSYLGVAPEELVTAARGCWASALTTAVLERAQAAGVAPTALALAVLVQPEIRPVCGGAADVHADGLVTVVGVSGSPSGLLTGWDPGARLHVDGRGQVTGDRDHLAEDTARGVAALARRVADALGVYRIEWASAQGRLVLLQALRGSAPDPVQGGRPPAKVPAALHPPLAGETAARIARLVRRFPGPLADELVLPWAVALREVPQVAPSAQVDPSAAFAEARSLARQAAAATWTLPPGRADQEAGRTLATLRGGRADPAVARLELLRPIPAPQAARILSLLAGVGEVLTARGGLRDPAELWALPPARVEMLVVEQGPLRLPAAPHRLGPDPWEPFVQAAVAVCGKTTIGEPAAPGTGAGRARPAGAPPAPLGPRDVLVASRPLPDYAPLLWGAAGLVTLGGSPAAHLVEVARSLGVPAVTRCHLHDVLDGPPDAHLLSVDGYTGTVSALRR